VRRPGASAALASAALVAGGMVVSVLAPTRRPLEPRVDRPALVPQAPVAPARLVAPTTREAVAPVRAAEPVESSVLRAPERALAELERLLAHEPFDEHTFLGAARALAPRLDPAALEAALAADGPPARRIAAAELLRARAERSGGVAPLPAGAARHLRALAHDAPAPLADAAARILLAQGGLAEARHWIAALNDDSAALRLRAARALAWTDPTTSARELAEALSGVADAHARSRAAATLARLAARLEPWARAELAEVLAVDPAADRGLARVALELARAAPDPLATVLDPSEPEQARFAAAVELAREPSLLAPAARAEAVASLRAALAPEEPAVIRRAALHALGALAQSDAAGDLARTAQTDPDPTVRAAALVALRRCDPELRLACLAEAERHEPVPAVRAVAASERARSATPRD
jgi:HEAT repeat protein